MFIYPQFEIAWLYVSVAVASTHIYLMYLDLIVSISDQAKHQYSTQTTVLAANFMLGGRRLLGN